MATAENNVSVLSAPATSTNGAIGRDCTYISLWTASSGGNLLHWAALSNDPSPLVAQAQIEFLPNTIIIQQLPGTNESEAMAQRGASGRVTPDVYLQYHSGSPGNTGTANVIPLGRTRITRTQFDIA